MEAGGSRSTAIVEFSNDFENSKRSSRQKRWKARVQVQKRFSRRPCVWRSRAPLLYLLPLLFHCAPCRTGSFRALDALAAF